MTETGGRRGESTREAILAAAETVFAQHGFDGARVDTIAEVSAYNKTLIFRYFGDKVGLYAAVLKRIDGEANELMASVFAPLLNDEAATADREQFSSFLKTLVQTLFDYLYEHPRFVRMLVWEMAEGWQTYAQIVSQFSSEDADQFELLFRRAQSAGLLRSGFLPVIQLSTLTQICVTYLASLPLYQMLLPGQELFSAESRAQARKYMVDFVVAGMMSDPGATKLE